MKDRHYHREVPKQRRRQRRQLDEDTEDMAMGPGDPQTQENAECQESSKQ